MIGDMWQLRDLVKADAVAVTTNGMIKKNGCLVMGKGVAKECLERYPRADIFFGKMVREQGNKPHYYFPEIGKKTLIISLPTKHDWRNASDLELIKSSLEELVKIADKFNLSTVLLPRPGCGLGGLQWTDVVEPLAASILDDRFIVVSR